jgi:hypothetical protein
VKPFTVPTIFRYKMQYGNTINTSTRRACSTEETRREIFEDECIRVRLQCTELYHISKLKLQLIVDVLLSPLQIAA